MLKYTYADEYLAPLVTDDRETRATADVAVLGTFPDAWQERLVRLRAYILTCQESQAAPDDLFASKLKTYQKEFDALLPAAQAAADATTSPTGTGMVYSIPLERA